MDILEETFEQLYDIGLTDTHMGFSERWLGCHSSYTGMIRASGKEPSLTVLVKLAARLKQHHAILASSNLNREEAIRIYPLVKMVWNYVYERALK